MQSVEKNKTQSTSKTITSTERPDDFEKNSKKLKKNPAETNAENTGGQTQNTFTEVTDEIEESVKNSPSMQSVEKNKTQSTSKTITSTERPDDFEKNQKDQNMTFQKTLNYLMVVNKKQPK